MISKEQQEKEKKLAGEKAVEFIENGMTVGLGTGSTVYYAILKTGELVKNGLSINAISSSNATTILARSLNIPLKAINDIDSIDLNIDGVDEVDPNLNGIKGGGGALLFEKIVALFSKKNIWIADSSKLSQKLGKFPLPVEVIPFGYKKAEEKIREMNIKPVIRIKENEFYKTDSGNYILDIHTDGNVDLLNASKEIKLITGVVETGMFADIADILIIGKNNETEIIHK